MLNEQNPRAVIGANNPPSLEAILRERHAPVFADVEKIKRRLKSIPKTVDSEKDSEKVIAIISDAGKVIKAVEAARAAEVEEFLRGQQTVNRTFNAETRDTLAPLIAAAKKINDAFMAAKVAREREEQKKAADLLRDQAEAAAKKAQEAEDAGQNRVADVQMSAAAALEQQADAAEARASSSSTNLSKTVTSTGAKASVSMVWDHRNVNRDALDLEALRHFLSDDAIDKALSAYVKAGRRSIRGAEIYERPKGNYR